MPDVRETLVELICEAHSKATDAEVFADATYAQQLEMEADHLIANGVTIQRWIPVEERLPETHKTADGCVCSDVLIFRQKTTVHMGYCVKQIEIIAEEPVVITRWYDQAGHRWEDVTHWTPLPEPPKEE